jgi:hypothetical protein
VNPIDALKRIFGPNLEGMARLRLGRGVVGNTTYALYAAVAAAVGITWALDNSPGMALLADAGIGVTYLIYLFGTYIFAHSHPDLAMLGDSEWLAYRQSEMASKDQPNLPALPPTSDPSRPIINGVNLIEAPDREI